MDDPTEKLPSRPAVGIRRIPGTHKKQTFRSRAPRRSMVEVVAAVMSHVRGAAQNYPGVDYPSVPFWGQLRFEVGLSPWGPHRLALDDLEAIEEGRHPQYPARMLQEVHTTLVTLSMMVKLAQGQWEPGKTDEVRDEEGAEVLIRLLPRWLSAGSASERAVAGWFWPQIEAHVQAQETTP